ncbi:MAG: substrate-binding domain-containing protein [Rivularia sp. (in: cyanobacteria)]
MAIIKLKIRESKEGFQVDLTTKQLDVETEGFLPPLPPQLETSFNNWQLAYRQIDAVRSYIAPAPGMRITPKSVTKYSSAEHTTSVKECLNQWLNSGDSKWLPVRDRLIAIAQQLHQKNEEIRVIIDAKDNLRRLPWQEWNLFEEHYPQVEIALSAAKNSYKKTTHALPQSSKIRVLVTVGRSDGINTKNDLEIIKELEQHGAEVVCLMQPNRQQLCDALWNEQGYHIFIFTGHSGSREDGHIGWIELNDTDSLSIEEFKEALKEAINKGLQLAIFNSCDGLGLANQLAQLHLPRCIVMREPVPDKVAIEFLKHFFEEFTGDRSLSQALNKARKKLEHFNLDYPGAIWLPTICITPNVKPLTWKSLHQGDVVSSEIDPNPTEIEPKKKNYINLLISFGLIGLFGSCSIVVTGKNPFPNLFGVSPESETTEQRKANSDNSVIFPSGTFYYGGSTTWAPINNKVKQVLEIVHPKFKVEYTHPKKDYPGSATGIKMLLKGELDFALSSRRLTSKEKEDAEKLGFVLEEIPVAIDAIAVAVNRNLNIDELTLTQLEGIYTGRIRNWQELGGQNLPIVAYSRLKEAGGTVEYLSQYVLRGKEIDTIFVQPVSNTTQGIAKVAAQPGSIYYASASEIVNQCSVKPLKLGNTQENTVAPYQQPLIPYPDCIKQPNQVDTDKLASGDRYPITRRLYIIYKKSGINMDEIDLHENLHSVKESAEAARAYANWLKTNEGKNLINQAGFAPIN